MKRNKILRYENGKPKKCYIQHKGILSRCSEKAAETRSDYTGNSIHPEWLLYDNWLTWANQQVGFLEVETNGRIWSIDKDILKKGNKHYCPELCVFVPNQLNQFFKLQNNSRGEFLLGASPQNHKNEMYKVRINNGQGQHIYLGQYETQEEAHEAYLNGKDALGKQIAKQWEGLVDPRVIQVVSNFKQWFNS